MFTVVAFELFYGQPVGIGDVSIALDDRDDPGTIVFTQEFGCVVSDIAKSLDDNGHGPQIPAPVYAIFLGVAQVTLDSVLNPLPVASVLPAIPPLANGLPVTQALAFMMSDGPVRLYSSAIQAMVCSLVPISGAGTFRPGHMRLRLASSWVNRRVIRSSSWASHSVGSILSAPFDPPNGTSTTAHFRLMSAASASTSS